MTRTVRVYLGAHKTASTHVQHMLVHSEALIERNGALVSEPLKLRQSDWMPAFFQAVRQHQTGKIDPEVRARLRAPLPPSNTDWVITDENILGTPREMLEGRGVYTFAGKRLKTLAAVFADCRIEAFMSMRSYDSFFASLYAEVVRNRGHVPFAPFRALAQDGGWSWQDTAADLVAAFGAENVTLWDYGDFRTLMPQVISRLSGMNDPDQIIAAYPERTTRPSLSQTAMDLIAQLAPAIGAEETLALTEKLAEHYSVGTGAPPFSPFSDLERQAMKQRYRTDLAAIAARWPQVTMLRPEEAPAVARTA